MICNTTFCSSHIKYISSYIVSRIRQSIFTHIQLNIKLKTLGAATPTQTASFPTKKNYHFRSVRRFWFVRQVKTVYIYYCLVFILCVSPTPVCTRYLLHTCAWASFAIQGFWCKSACGLSDSNKVEWNKTEVRNGMVGMASPDKGKKFWMEIYTRN